MKWILTLSHAAIVAIGYLVACNPFKKETKMAETKEQRRRRLRNEGYSESVIENMLDAATDLVSDQSSSYSSHSNHSHSYSSYESSSSYDSSSSDSGSSSSSD